MAIIPAVIFHLACSAKMKRLRRVGSHLSIGLVPETENETMMVKKQICEDIEGVI